MILTVDKGGGHDGYRKKIYIRKTKDLLNQHTYKTIPADLSTRQKNKLINLLKNIQDGRGHQ